MDNKLFKIALTYIAQTPVPPEEDTESDKNLTDVQIKEEVDAALKMYYRTRIGSRLKNLTPSELNTIGKRVVESYKPGLGAQLESILGGSPLNRTRLLGKIEEMAYLDKGSIKDTVIAKFADNPTKDPQDVRTFVEEFLGRIQKLIESDKRRLRRAPSPEEAQKGLAVPPSNM